MTSLTSACLPTCMQIVPDLGPYVGQLTAILTSTVIQQYADLVIIKNCKRVPVIHMSHLSPPKL